MKPLFEGICLTILAVIVEFAALYIIVNGDPVLLILQIIVTANVLLQVPLYCIIVAELKDRRKNKKNDRF